jgi:chromatin segregation and condensation protein Rec8/ScpA/Scc1 (kleisin family)
MSEKWTKMRLRPGWASTFMAGLELAGQGDVVLGQNEAFEAIRVTLA